MRRGDRVLQYSHPFSFLDALTAATSHEDNPTLATTNARHFPVEGLKVQEFPTG